MKKGKMAEISKNSIVTVTVEDINNLGYGVGKYNGKTVFISGAVDGDICQVKIIKVNKSYCVGIIHEMIEPSKHRITPICPHHKSCGGCAYQSISYEHELELKTNYVRYAFKKAGIADAVINATVSDRRICGYRNKAQYPVTGNEQDYIIGFYATKSHRVIDASGCTLQPEVFGSVCSKIKEFLLLHKISTYDEITKKGLIRHIYIRCSHDEKSLMLCLVINGRTTKKDDALVSFVRKKLPEVSTLLLNINTEDTNVVLGDEYICLFGDGYIKDEMCGVSLEIAPAAFYQVNHGMAERLYKKAAELAGLTGKETVYDLYCGIGSIGLSMHKEASRIVGVDIEPSAIQCAKRNASACGIENAQFFCADASASDDLFESAGIYDSLEESVVIFDPPRKGSSEKLIDYVCEKHPKRVVYISCNPDTLARDCVYFNKNGYTMSDVTPFDLFPRTGHVESVVCLMRTENVHNMKLDPSPFSMIKSGEKTIELRLYDEKRRQINEGDKIVFKNSETGELLSKKVVGLYRFKSFEELYSTLPLLRCGYTKENVDKAVASDMQKYYTEEDETKYGVVGIELL